MPVGNETVYIKGEQNVEVRKKEVTLGDVLSIECANRHIVSRLKTIKLMNMTAKGKQRYVVSILKIIECIHGVYPNLEIENLGEKDMIITYEEQKTSGNLIHLLKIAGVTLISFIGAAFSIMTFNNDVDTSKLFSQIYELLTGTPKQGFSMLELTYCIGLIVGILIFFNHFGGKRFSVDPTPMEVEMRLYEKDIQMTLIETYSRKEQELDVGKTDASGTHRI